MSTRVVVSDAQIVRSHPEVDGPGPSSGGLLNTGLVPLAGRYAHLENFDVSNGIDVRGNARVGHKTVAAADSVWLGYINPHPTAPVTITGAAVEYGGEIVRARFDGNTGVTIAPRQWAFAGPVSIDIPAAGELVYSRTSVLVAPGDVWTKTHFCFSASEPGEASESGSNSLGDKSQTGTIVEGTGDYMGFGPTALLYAAAGEVPCIVGVGDSIGAGYYDDPTPIAKSAARRAFEGHSSYLNAAASSLQMGEFNSSSSFGAMTHPMSEAGTWVINELGINDFIIGGVPVATLQARWLTAWKAWAALGKKVLQYTLTPVTSSGTYPAGTGQVTHATVNPKRVAANAWLRDGSPIDATTKNAVAVGTSSNVLRAGDTGHPLAATTSYPDGCIDVSDAVENVRDSGVWLPNLSFDGIHPHRDGHAAMAAVIVPAEFT